MGRLQRAGVFVIFLVISLMISRGAEFCGFRAEPS
jgi:hypothetical protein